MSGIVGRTAETAKAQMNFASSMLKNPLQPPPPPPGPFGLPGLARPKDYEEEDASLLANTRRSGLHRASKSLLG